MTRTAVLPFVFLLATVGCGPRPASVFTAVATAAAAVPTPFASKAGDLTVTFPDRFKLYTDGDDPAAKGFEENARVVRDGTEFFAVTVTYDPVKGKLADPQKVMAAAQAGGFGVHAAKLVEENETTFGEGKLPARTAVGEAPDGKRLRFLIVMSGSRMLSVGVVGRPEAVAGPAAEAFFKSAAVSPGPSGLPPDPGK